MKTDMDVKIDLILASNELRTLIYFILESEREAPKLQDPTELSDEQMMETILNDPQINGVQKRFIMGIKAFGEARGYLSDKQRESIKLTYDSNCYL